ncbi:MAG: EutN/CcmL family microcompartment protein [Alkalispirochaeta sp.]|jgi:microcompartment protein CcmK/EutM
MVFARVRGTVVTTTNEDRIPGGRYLVVSLSSSDGTKEGASLVALDLVQADFGQLVLVSQGSSCRQTEYTKNTAVDAVIVGIVDTVHTETGVAPEVGAHAE